MTIQDAILLPGVWRLKSCCERLERQVQEQLGLTQAQCALLPRFPREGRIPLAALKEASGLSASRLGRVVDELVRDGYVVREAMAADRRGLEVELTPQGREVHKRILSLFLACESMVVAELSAAERETVTQGLALLSQAFELLEAQRA